MTGETAGRVLTQRDFDRFAALSRDDNPIHCDPDFARTTHFGATVAHGMFLYALLAARMQRARPEPFLPVAQTLMFPLPTFAGDAVVAQLSSEPGGDAACFAMGTSIRCIARGGQDIAAAEQPVTAHGAALLLPQATARTLAALRAPEGGEPEEAGDSALYHLRTEQTASAARMFDETDIGEYIALTGDENPFHADARFARSRGFDGALVPLPLLAGMFSDLLGTQLPGRGTGWMKQSLRLCSAARPGEPLAAQVRIRRLRAGKLLVNLSTSIRAGRRVIVQGEALVLVRNLENKGEAGNA